MKSIRICFLIAFISVLQLINTQAALAQTAKAKSRTSKPPAKEDDTKSTRESRDANNPFSPSSANPSPNSVNVFVHPLELVLSDFKTITLSCDFRVARFVTLGADYLSMTLPTGGSTAGLDNTGSLRGGRLRADAYLNGRAFTSSFVAQLNYNIYTIGYENFNRPESVGVSGPGVMFGWRWFWGDPGESGLNVGLMLGAYILRGESGTKSVSSIIPDGRLEFGIAF